MSSRGRHILNLALQEMKESHLPFKDITKASKNIPISNDNNVQNFTQSPNIENIDIEKLPIIFSSEAGINLSLIENGIGDQSFNANDYSCLSSSSVIDNCDSLNKIVIEESDEVQFAEEERKLKKNNTEFKKNNEEFEEKYVERDEESDRDEEFEISEKMELSEALNQIVSGDEDETKSTEECSQIVAKADYGNMTEGRKRQKIANKNNWKRIKNERLRMKGEEYLGFSRDKNKNFKQNVIRPSRQIGERCMSKMCMKSKKRFCSTFGEDTRREIFSNFWKNITWDQKKKHL